MTAHRLEADEKVSVQRERPVVCIPVYGGFDLFGQCVRSVLAHTAADVPILIADDASRDSRIEAVVTELAERR